MTDHSDLLLSAAELAHQKLRESGEGEWARWLRDTFEQTEPEQAAVINAIVGLGTPLLTTNYDDLIEKVATTLKHVTWLGERAVSRVVRGDDRRVLHLHGHWEEPESVVLGIRSYEAVKNNPHTQAAMRTFGMSKSLLFVGCGDEGLDDPNWGNFLTWLASIETHAGVEHRHYRLVREADKGQPHGRLFPLVYGKAYDDLVPFLNRLRPTQETSSGQPRTPVPRQSSALPESVVHYVERLAQETSTLTLLGMGAGLQIDLPISDAYIPLRTCGTDREGMEGRGRFDPEGFQQAERIHRDVRLENVFRSAAKTKHRGVLLLGDPGAG
jgi:hypothetical protein